ncbi:zinc ABC transporter substrate-binding protein [Isoptericola sp. S6320L]|uniref:metal ABC transporter solute-binding protein, Zn/Mn family n=1 Tax=Isoptericola sp. S6320L TaxID=2926411 RepID=UPI001FF551DB|nr:zinc ABC transporter substrate-binding protein [Isoptericola sp. S6320L]MCK0117470.1 zinc ABC transporter substrate-binding protein [Isoptericola sp. S6320L]
MTRRLALPVAAALPLALVLAACGTDGGGAGDDDGTVQVLASFYPLQYVAEQVGGDLVTVDNLTPPAAEPHDLELAPSQVREVGDADLVVFQSGFQPAVDEAVEARAPEHVVDAAEIVTLEESPGSAEHADEHEGETAEEHAAHADEDEEAAGDGHDHGNLDPHFWLDPTLLIPVADEVATELGAADPDNAATYTANAEALTATLEDLDAEYAAALEPCQGETLVTSHAAFGYLAERYGLSQVGISALDPEAEPSPARLREIGAVVEDNDVQTIFTETLTSPKVAETLAADLGVSTAVLDPLEGLSTDAAESGSDYISVMDANLAAITEGLGCA